MRAHAAAAPAAIRMPRPPHARAAPPAAAAHARAASSASASPGPRLSGSWPSHGTPRGRGASAPARAGFNFAQSVEDGTLTWDTGGGRWTPGSGGSGSGGSGGSGDSSAADGWPIGRGFAWAAALFFMLAKCLVCWCTDDPKAAATSIDLGFLLGMALLACASLAAGPLGALRPLLVQLTLGHILAEMAFYGVILNAIDPGAAYKMAPEMWLHHIAVAVGGAHTVALMGRAGFGALAWVGTQLIVTEITTFLPVAFHQAIKNRRMTGGRSVVLGVLFPSAFALRCALSARVLGNYMAIVRAMGVAAVPYWWVSAGASAAILGLNVFWTAKIVWGGARQVARRRAKAAGKAGGAKGGKAQQAAQQPLARAAVYGERDTVYSEASEAAVYSEMSDQKRRQPRNKR